MSLGRSDIVTVLYSVSGGHILFRCYPLPPTRAPSVQTWGPLLALWWFYRHYGCLRSEADLSPGPARIGVVGNLTHYGRYCATSVMQP